MWVHAEDTSFDVPSGQMMLELSTGDLQDDVVRILEKKRQRFSRLPPNWSVL